MIITADMIRRFPFAVAPHRVTDDLQILIARDMARQAHAEGHHKRLPPDQTPRAEDVEVSRARVQAQIFRCLAAYGGQTISAIRQATGMDRVKIETALIYMVADGRVNRLERKTRGGSTPGIYEINRSFAPDEVMATLGKGEAA